MNSPLFRKEALDHQRESLFGAEKVMLDFISVAARDRKVTIMLLLENVICYEVVYIATMKLIDYKCIFRFFNGMLGRNAECYTDVVRPELG